MFSLEKQIDNPDGSYSTHKMAHSTTEDGAVVYPTIVEIDGKLKELSGKEAIAYAKRTGEFIHFDSESEAAKFAKGSWKKVVGLN